MQKAALVMFALAAAVAAVSARPDKEVYTSKYDNIDLKEILSNRRLLIPYVKCVLDQGRCTAEGKELKSHITDALQTGCSKCTPTQDSGSRQVIGHLINHEADFWNQLKAKYDPQHNFVKKYETELRTLKA